MKGGSVLGRGDNALHVAPLSLSVKRKGESRRRGSRASAGTALVSGLNVPPMYSCTPVWALSNLTITLLLVYLGSM